VTAQYGVVNEIGRIFPDLQTPAIADGEYQAIGVM